MPLPSYLKTGLTGRFCSIGIFTTFAKIFENVDKFVTKIWQLFKCLKWNPKNFRENATFRNLKIGES
jgi:hypothetical protein